MARNSIELRVPRAVALTALDPASRLELAQQFGVANLRELEARMRDRAFVRDRVAALPALCSILLEIVVEAGGMIMPDQWHALARARSKASAEALNRAIQALFEAGFLVATHSAYSEVPRVGVVSPVSELLYELLAGISLPSVPPPHDTAADHARRRRVRDTIALCALTAHRRVRFTQAGQPDRTTLKRCVKDLGVPLEDAEAALLTARSVGWLLMQAERARPDARALIEADLSLRGGSHVAAYAALIPEHEWISLEALSRQVEPPGIERGPRALEALSIQPSLQFSEHAGHTWVRRVPPEAAFGDGHVTPSFEVLLGPKAAFGTVARVALCCELVRLDHVLTFKLTPESVAAGLSCGLDAEQIKAGLSAVSPHGLPDNVAFMLEDWIAGTKLVSVQRGVFIFAEPDVADRLATALRNELVSRPQPGVLEVNSEITELVLDKALVQARAQLRADAPATAGWTAPPRSLPPRPEPDAGLRVRVVQAQVSGDFTSDLPDVVEQDVSVSGGAETMRTLTHLAREQHAPAVLFEMLEACEKWAKEAAEPLRQWAQKVRSSERAQAELAIDVPLLVLPWLMLNAEWRKRTLMRANNVAQLSQQASACVTHPERMREDAARLLARMDDEDARVAMARLLSAYAGSQPEWQAFDDDLDDSQYDEDFDPRVASRELSEPLAEARREREQRLGALSRQPEPGTLAALDLPGVYGLLQDAIDTERIVHLQLSDQTVYTVYVEDLRTRGKHNVLHCTELSRLESRVIKLGNIVAAKFDEPASGTARAQNVASPLHDAHSAVMSRARRKR